LVSDTGSPLSDEAGFSATPAERRAPMGLCKLGSAPGVRTLHLPHNKIAGLRGRGAEIR